MLTRRIWGRSSILISSDSSIHLRSLLYEKIFERALGIVLAHSHALSRCRETASLPLQILVTPAIIASKGARIGEWYAPFESARVRHPRAKACLWAWPFLGYAPIGVACALMHATRVCSSVRVFSCLLVRAYSASGSSNVRMRDAFELDIKISTKWRAKPRGVCGKSRWIAQ